jgi:ectoine hydroxylase-related dioxygenase (phytanoyl-CoA dioxygenase family)
MLTDEQVAFFRSEGYLVLDEVAPPEEVAWMRAIYDRLFAERAGRSTGDHFDLAGADDDDTEAALPQILEPSKYAPELRDGVYRTNARAIAEQLLGRGVESRGEHAILKPTRVGAETPWHQDEAYWGGASDHDALSIWIPLQPATPENGCMCFIPGSHRGDVLPHHAIAHDPRVHGLEADGADSSAAVACPIPAGGCTIHHSRTLHYTGPNRSDEPRRAYILMFGLPPVPRPDGRRFPWRRGRPRGTRVRRPRAAPREPVAPTRLSRRGGARGTPDAAAPSRRAAVLAP